MLRGVFNVITKIHSREAVLKRIGTVTIYSPIRITPSNYFRFLEGPSSTVIHGREFIIPVDSIKGHARQLITFGETPTQGNFILTYDGVSTADLAYNSTADDIETALQGLLVTPGLDDITVSGDFATGFTVTFIGVESPLLLVATLGVVPLQDVTNTDVVITVAKTTGLQWVPILKRGDKILDPNYGSLAIDEMIEMVNLGGEVIGYRVRCE